MVDKLLKKEDLEGSIIYCTNGEEECFIKIVFPRALPDALAKMQDLFARFVEIKNA